MNLNLIAEMLTPDELARLREAFDGAELVRADSAKLAAVYPPLAPWGAAIGEMFYRPEPIAPRERELCLITLLAVRAPGISLANHIYWGLMEGLTPDQVIQALGLAGCYAGLPAFVEGVLTAGKTFTVLKRIAALDARGAGVVFAALVRELANVTA